MTKFDYRDMISGALITFAGGFIVIYTLSNYSLGTIQRMGTGMFPLGVGVILVILGLLIAITSLFRSGSLQPIESRAPIAVLASIGAFAITVIPFGLLPAVVAVTVVSSMAEKFINWKQVAILSLCLCGTAVLIFKVGLSFPLPLFGWVF